MARENWTWAMIASWARSATWAIRSQTKLWATFCVYTRSHQRRSGVVRPHGRSSSGRTWTCLLAQTSGTDFFTVEVLTSRGLITYYILFFIEIGSRRVSLGGITRYPDSCWMEQVARNATSGTMFPSTPPVDYLSMCQNGARRQGFTSLRQTARP
jgi:hypothetical protein